jgi:hypothetical protein
MPRLTSLVTIVVACTVLIGNMVWLLVGTRVGASVPILRVATPMRSVRWIGSSVHNDGSKESNSKKSDGREAHGKS